MPLWKNYLLPQSIDEALAALSSAPEPSRLVGGGTDLLLDMQQGRHPPVDTLVDVTSIPELGCLELRGGQLFIGAAVPLRKIAASPLVNAQAQALAEACVLIGGPQVRNTATLGGNVAHALPAGDGTIALAALDAQVEVASPSGRKRVSILDLFRGPGQVGPGPARRAAGGLLPSTSRCGRRLGLRPGDAPAGGGAADPQHGRLAAHSQ